MEQKDITKHSSASLSFLGDAVFSLLARERLILSRDLSLGEYNKKLKNYVSARAQSKIYRGLTDFLTEEEKAIMKRGRNATSHSRAKGASVAEYRHATGVEALFGWLRLTGQEERIKEIFEKCVEICDTMI